MKKPFSSQRLVLIAIFILMGYIAIMIWIQTGGTKLSRTALDVNNNSALLATWALGSPIDALTANSDSVVFYDSAKDILTSRNLNTGTVNWSKGIGFGNADAIEIYQN